MAWSFNLSMIAVVLYALLFLANTLYYKKIEYNFLILLLLPTVFNDILTTAFMEDFLDLSRYYIFIAPLFIFYGIMIYSIVKNRKEFRNKELIIAVFVWLATMIPSYFQTLNMYNSLLETLIYVNTIVIMLYFMSSTKIKKHDFYLVLILFATLGFIQMADDLFIGNTLEVIIDKITHKRIGVGWSKQNNLAQYAAFAIPFILYFASIKKGFCKYFYYVIGLLFVVFIILTSARTTFVSLAIIFIPLMVYLYQRRNKDVFKRDLIIVLASGAIILLAMILSGVAEAFIERMLNVGFDSTYRVKHWIMSIDHFKDAPLFGTGVLTTSEYIYLLPSYHNVFVDALTNTGIVGFLGTIYLFYVVIKQLLLNKKENFILSMSYITFFIAMNLDTAHINPITLLILFVSFDQIKIKNNEI
jgi:O-antigen ligase